MYQVQVCRGVSRMLQFLSKKLSTGFLGKRFVNTVDEKVFEN